MPKAKAKLPAIPRPRKSKEPRPALAATSNPQAPTDPAKIAAGLISLTVPIGDLQFDPANARRHDDRNLDAIRGSLAVYGQVKPVVVRKDTHVVVAGNGTLQAALSLGWQSLAAVFVEMDAATAAGYSIADNRASELGDWDKEALDKLLRECSTANDERLDAMMAELATDLKLYPTDGTDSNDDEADWPEPSQSSTYTITLRYDDSEELILKAFVGQDGPEPLDPVHTGKNILERIKAIVAAEADSEHDREAAA